MKKVSGVKWDFFSVWFVLIAVILVLAIPIFPVFASGKAIRIAMFSNDPVGIDVLSQAFSPDGFSVLAQISEPLLHPDVDGKLQGAIAHTWRQINATEWEFRIRKGITFHNGELCDGYAVKTSIETILDPHVGSAFSQPLNTIKSASVSSTDPYVVRIKTFFPDGMLLYRLSFAAILPPRYLKAVGVEGFHKRPVGTGPFRFVKWVPKKEIILKRNTDYWRKGFPKVDTLIYVILPPDKWIQALKEGRVNVVPFLDGRHIREVVKNKDLRVSKRKCLFTTVIMLHNRGPLAFKAVRQALNYALDKNDIVKYADYGNSIPVASLGLEESIGKNVDIKPYPYDMEKAKRLLAETPFAKGFTLKVLAGDMSEALAKIMKAQYSKINVRLDLEIVPRTDLTQKVMIYQIRNHLKRPDYDLVLYPVDNPLIDSSFTARWAYFSQSPWSLLRSRDYDEKYLWALKANPLKAHEKRLWELDRFFHEEAFSIFTTQRILTVVTHKGVTLPIPLSGSFYYGSLDQAEVN
ncbi:MAG: ABC transporter substrate-binding protein [Deltaproteobacteria bacterium]|nr:ABC transporter substrate-binding protein [Deltaproteobacteria bacterium]